MYELSNLQARVPSGGKVKGQAQAGSSRRSAAAKSQSLNRSHVG
jgi:hypothetical protein